MGFENRDYYREHSRGGPFAGFGNWLLSGRLSLFHAFGIHVQAHSSLLIYMLFTLLFMHNGYTWADRILSASLLFLIVLLHEFGHCFGARWSGGEADEIVMHPLGGLALTRPRSNWRAHLITTTCGPLVNVLLCLVCGIALYSLTQRIPWQPFYLSPWTPFRGWGDPAWWLYWLYQVNWTLLLFNLMPIFPLDGGRLTQEILWPKLGYYRSMRIAAMTGMIGAFVVGVYALATVSVGLIVLCVFGYMYCSRIRQMLLDAGPYAFGEYDNPSTYDLVREKARSKDGFFAKRAMKKSRQMADADRNEQAEIDRILSKVSEKGMHSLSRGEQKALKAATERQQKRDAARR